MRDYTTREAGERIGVSDDAIRMAVHRGKLIAYKRAGVLFIDGKELDRWNAIRLRGPRTLAKAS